MSTLTCMPGRDCVNSLGIPVDNLTPASAVDRIIAMARAGDGRARLVSTLNVDFLVNSLGSALSRPRHPELLEVLRGSDLVTADGFPIVWLSRILGRPLHGRVCGSDLLPALAERASREGLSLFLLGGGEGVAAEAGQLLERRYPGLRIAGTAAPMIRTSGDGLLHAAEDDAALLEQIHSSAADILLVGLGNPKQELWFNRNRSRLRTPVSIGVGGSFEFITGRIRRAPVPWQRLNLEWLYRIGQDPKRLWKRYVKGLFKLSVLAAPVIWSRCAAGLQPSAAQPPADGRLPWRQLWSSREQSLSLLAMPRSLGPAYLDRVVRDLSGSNARAGLRILDFSRVRHIRLDAQQEFFNLAGLLAEQRDSLQLMGLSTRVRRQLSAARLLDLIDGDSQGALQQLTRRPTGTTAFQCQSYAMSNATLIMLGGRVTREALAATGFVECLLGGLRHRRCILDLRNVDLLETSGIAELLPLLNPGAAQQDRVLISGVGHNIRQMLRMAEVEVSAAVIDDRRLLSLISGGPDHD